MKINLLPDLVIQRRRDARIKRLSLLAVIGWCALLVLVIVGVLAYKLLLQSQFNSAQSKYNSLNATVNSSDNVAFRADALAVQNSLTALDQLFGSQRKLDTIAAALAAVTPKTVTLKEVQIDDTGVVNITGSTTSFNEVSNFLAGLKTSNANSSKNGYFDQVVLNAANRADVTNITLSITAQYYAPVGGGNQ